MAKVFLIDRLMIQTTADMFANMNKPGSFVYHKRAFLYNKN